MKENILNILLLLLMLTASADAAEMKEYETPEVNVQYEVPLHDAAKRITSVYKKARTDIETKVGWKLQYAPVVVLVRDNDAFQKTARNALVTAFAIPEKGLVVIDNSKMDRTPFDLQDTLKHELTHLLLHQNIAPLFLPKWLDEGVAQWASGGAADILRTGEKDLLQQAVLSQRIIELKDISSAFPDTPNGLALSYEESRSFVEFIVKQYGEKRFRSLLRSLENKETIEQAIYENLGVQLPVLEWTWKKRLSKEHSWISYVADHMYWILFFLAALISVAGYCAAKRRMRNYRDDEDELEEGESEEQSANE